MQRGCCDLTPAPEPSATLGNERHWAGVMLHTYAPYLPVHWSPPVLTCSVSLPLSPHSTAIQVNMDLMLAKMAKASQHWKDVGMTIAMEHKEHIEGVQPQALRARWSSWDGTGSQSLLPYQHTWRAFQIHCSILQQPWAR